MAKKERRSKCQGRARSSTSDACSWIPPAIHGQADCWGLLGATALTGITLCTAAQLHPPMGTRYLLGLYFLGWAVCSFAFKSCSSLVNSSPSSSTVSCVACTDNHTDEAVTSQLKAHLNAQATGCRAQSGLCPYQTACCSMVPVGPLQAAACCSCIPAAQISLFATSFVTAGELTSGSG